MAVDALIILESFAVALLFRFNGDVPQNFWVSFWPFSVFGAALFVALLYESGVYRSVLRYTGIYQGVRIASATAISTGLLLIADFVTGEFVTLVRPMPLSVVLVGAVLAYVQLVAVRLYPRVFYELSLREVRRQKRAVIAGAGEQGIALASHISRTPDMNTRVVGFVSEARGDLGKHIDGLPVFGLVEELEKVVENGIDQVIIAMPYAGREKVDFIWRACTQAEVEVKVMPELEDMLSQGAIRLRELQIEDLLGREPVEIDLDALSSYINGKRVLITGAAGSIGGELSRQISRLGPARLMLADRDESGLYYLDQELKGEEFGEAEPVVADVTLPERMNHLFETFQPQIVFHAAAYKHVPMMELQATEAITNNVYGTLNVARLAGEYGAEKFINVSTDKAVNPINVMGATKRLSEMLVYALSTEHPRTIHSSVRFGNVLGSRGSVVPTFQQQIEAGGPVTVTHPEMSRYFMTIPEAVSLILQAGAMSEEYGTYVLEMGRPVGILDLARKMIEIMGAPGMQIKFTGLRPGEKLREELYEESEIQEPTDHMMVFRLASENHHDTARLFSLAGDLVLYARSQQGDKALELLRQITPGYTAEDVPAETPQAKFRGPHY